MTTKRELFRQSAIKILETHYIEQIIPKNSKVVVFHIDLSFKHAFNGMVEHEIKCAPVCNSCTGEYIGMLTITDFIHLLLHFKEERGKIIQKVGSMRMRTWAAYLRQKGTARSFRSIEYNVTLMKAIEECCKFDVHRLAVMNKSTEEHIFVSILSFQRILSFLLSQLSEEDISPLKDTTVGDYYDCLGCYDNLVTITYNHKLVDALSILIEKKITALPIVDENGTLIDTYRRNDVVTLAHNEDLINFPDLTVGNALACYPSQEDRTMLTCTLKDSMYTALTMLSKSKRSRLLVVNEKNENKLIGIISFSDIFGFFINSCSQSNKKVKMDT